MRKFTLRNSMGALALIAFIAALALAGCDLIPKPEDATPPAEVSGLTAVPGNGTVVLSWTDPADSDFHRVMINYSKPRYSLSVFVARGARTRTFTGLTNDVYTFTVKTVDSSGNTSAGITVTATPVNRAAAPTASPPAGAYAASQTVTLTTATPGAAIWYTTDGTTPSANPPNGASISPGVNILVNMGETLKAIAVKAGMVDSALLTAAYILCAATPTASPPGGTYTVSQTVILATTTPGADIWYTTDGTTPSATSATSTLYTVPITVNMGKTLKAIAVAGSMADSALLTEVYTQAGTVAAPTANPPAGTYTVSPQTVTLTTTTPGAAIWYTTDGTTPSANPPNGTLYTGPITVNPGDTLKAIAIDPSGALVDSVLLTAAYTPQAVEPTASPGAGVYAVSQMVTLATATPGASIYYTTNGTTPTSSSSLYTAPITVTMGTTLKAIAVKAGMTDSTVLTAAYTQKYQVAPPTATPGTGTYAVPQTVRLATATPGASIYYTTDGTTPSTGSTRYLAAVPLTVSPGTTLLAIAARSDMTDSPVMTEVYTQAGFAAAPTATPPGGAYAGTQMVSLFSTTPGAVIYYTITGGGRTPTVRDTLHTGLIAITPPDYGVVTLCAIAAKDGLQNSAVLTAVYTKSQVTTATTTPTTANPYALPQQSMTFPLQLLNGLGQEDTGDLANSSLYPAGTTWKVYDTAAGTTLAPFIIVTFDRGVLTLEHTWADIPAGDYWVTAQAPNSPGYLRTESARLKITVGATTAAPVFNPDRFRAYSPQEFVDPTLNNRSQYGRSGGAVYVYPSETSTTKVPGISARFDSQIGYENKLLLSRSGFFPPGHYWIAIQEPGKYESARTKLMVYSYTLVDPTNPDIKRKFGDSSPGPGATFDALHGLISNPLPEDDFTQIIRTGDYIDLPSFFSVQGQAGMYDTAVSNGRLLRLIVVGVNSFKRDSTGNSGTVNANNPNAPNHVVFQFQNVPFVHNMNETDSNAGGYKASGMRAFITGGFLDGLKAYTGLNNTMLWAPNRKVANGGSGATAADTITDTLWLPTVWEMFGVPEWSSPAYEPPAARLEYYTDNARRIKYNASNAPANYWLASPNGSDAVRVSSVESGGVTVLAHPSKIYGVAPAFCIR